MVARIAAPVVAPLPVALHGSILHRAGRNGGVMPKRQNPEEKREGRKDNAAEDAAEKTKGTLKVPSKPKRK